MNTDKLKNAESSTKYENLIMKYPSFLSDATDGCPPKCIPDAFKQYSPQSASEVMNILVHLSMLENGFKLCSKDDSLSLPPSWRDIANTVKYLKPSYILNETSSRQVDFTCSIVTVTMGTTKQVLASFVGQDSEISVKFDMNQYIQGDSLEPKKLKKLSHFDCQIRNDLLYPLRISAHRILGMPAPWHLLGLPYDIILLILKLLPIKDILNLSLTCTSLKATLDDRRVWFYLYKRDFSLIDIADDMVSCNWKDIYKSAYRRKKVKEFRMCAEEVIDWSKPYARFIPPDVDPDPCYPYGPWVDPYPPPFPYADPDSQYFGGDLDPIRRRGRIGPTIFRPRGSRGAPRFNFL